MNYTINEIPDEAVELSGNEMIPIWQGETKKVSVATLTSNVYDYIDKQIADAVETSQSYSTEEQLTGGTWIDGKPIYRKVINDTITISVGDGGFNHGITNLDTLTFFDMFNNKGATRYYAQVRGITSTQIQTYNLKNYAFTVDIIILEYTKTTD